MWAEGLILAVSVFAGGIAAVTGFGIGSLLTPALALQFDTRLAVAAVSIPHVIGTAIRLWLLSGGVDRKVFWSFGLTSAAGGLAGALLQGWATNRWLNLVFGGLLLFAAVSEVSGLASRMRFRGPVAWIAGAVSGVLGGLVGNQGGLRSAALLGFGLSRQSFVATATAIGLVVDGARMPVPDPRDPRASPAAEIVVDEVGGRVARQVTRLGLLPSDLEWTPDGEGLVFAADVAYRDELKYGAADLWHVRLDGTVQQLTDDGYVHASPTFSPDGRLLAYTRATGTDPSGVSKTSAFGRASPRKRT